MNFSKMKLQEGIATAGGATSSLEASAKGTEAATMGSQKSQTDKSTGNERLRRQRAQKADPRGAGQVFEDIQKKAEHIKSFESQKSDWRQELNEKVVDGQEREQHPFVTVMPTGDENLINAMKQMGKEVKNKKDAVKEEVQQLDEKKSKKCKEGYKRDEDGNCVKEKKSKTTIIVGRGWGYGGHHDHDDDNDGDGGDGDGGGGDGGGDGGGGMGEMFDALGDLLLKEKLESGKEYHARMKEKKKKPINPFPVSKKKQADKKRKQADIVQDTRTDAEKMYDATGPRPGSRYRGD